MPDAGREPRREGVARGVVRVELCERRPAPPRVGEPGRHRDVVAVAVGEEGRGVRHDAVPLPVEDGDEEVPGVREEISGGELEPAGEDLPAGRRGAPGGREVVGKRGRPELSLEGVRRPGRVDERGEARRVQEPDVQRAAASLREAREGDAVGVDRRAREGVVEAGEDVRLVGDAVGAVDVMRRGEPGAARDGPPFPEDEDGTPLVGRVEVFVVLELPLRSPAAVEEEERREGAPAVPRRGDAEVVGPRRAVRRRDVGEGEDLSRRQGRRHPA